MRLENKISTAAIIATNDKPTRNISGFDYVNTNAVAFLLLLYIVDGTFKFKLVSRSSICVSI